MINNIIKPYPYIQNRIQWCWAVACKIVGEQYKQNNPIWNKLFVKSENVNIQEYQLGKITMNQTGLREDIVRSSKGAYFIDALQRAIVMNANTFVGLGYEGDVAGDDEAKLKGLRYVVTGNVDNGEIDVVSLGYYDSEKTLPEQFGKEMQAVFQSGNYMIGNAILYPDRLCHSFVILKYSEKQVLLYDPWDGTETYYTEKEIFETGFLSALGFGIIKWIQFIK